ncbi:DOT1-domain-containing protein, partial [Panus rudis PR-1116 ss-1]
DFSNPADPEDRTFEPDPIHYPVVELEYPNTYASERFILLEPKDKDHYNPILCLQSTVHTIAEHYLTPQQQVLFGKLPSKSLSHLWDDDDDVPMTGASSRSGTPAAEGSATPDPLLKVLTDAALSSLSTFLPSPSVPSSSKTPLTFNFPRRLQSAINKRNGPQFLKVMDGVNAFLRMLKYPPLPNDAFKSTSPNGLMLNAKAKSTMPSAIIDRIVDETYQRAVGPHVESLKNYAAFSSETYGELMPKFISRLIKESRLNSDSLFLDLGSGVGNVVCQASLETGCRSFGIEILPAPAKVARSQLEQYQIRCRMWGVQMGEVQLEESDMLKSKALDELLPKADVVLVNNKVFGTTLNEAIKVKLLDLKEGAVVISLARFFPKKSTVSERNLDDISSIFQVTDREFESGDVSWTGNTDWYYIHKVDRASYADDKKKYESSRSSSTRASRSRK